MRAAAVITVIALLYAGLLPVLFRHWMHLADFIKIAISILLISPLAFSMGMPFPLGLSRVSREMPDFVPWAWGINGCASVVSGILATLLAVHLGFNVVVGLAAGLYLFAALLLRDATERTTV